MRSLLIFLLLWLPFFVPAQDRIEALQARTQARQQLGQNNFTAAISYYDKAIRHYPIWSTAFAERAYAKLKTGNSELLLTAITDCRQAVKYNPRNGFAKSVLHELQTWQVTNRPLSSDRQESLDKQFLLAGNDSGGDPANENTPTQNELARTSQPPTGNSPPTNGSLSQSSQQPIVITWISPNVADLPQGLLHNKSTLEITFEVYAKATKEAIEQATTVWIDEYQQPKGSKSLGEKAKAITPNRVQFKTNLTLVPGKHYIDIRVNLPNQPEARSSALAVDIHSTDAPKLYIYAFGINYDDNQDVRHLNFTGQDAKAIVRAFERQNGKLFDKVIRMKESTTLTQTTAIQIKKDLGKMATIPVIHTQDVVLIFISGHGEMREDDYKILGSDYDEDLLTNTTISYQDDILKNLRKLRCKKIVLFDACKGIPTLASNGQKSLPTLADIRKLLAETPPSTVAIFSCSDGQFSYEHSTWGHGAFTAAILEALEKGKANLNVKTERDSVVITIDELYSYLQKRVKDMVWEQYEARQEPLWEKKEIEVRDFEIYYLGKEQQIIPTMTVTNRTTPNKPDPKPPVPPTEPQKRLVVFGLNAAGDSMDWDLTNPSTDSIRNRVPKNWDVQIASGLGQTKLNIGAKGGSPFSSLVKKVSADVLCVITQQVKYRTNQLHGETLWVAEPTLVCQFIDVKTGGLLKQFMIPRINGTELDKDSALQSAIKRTLSGLTAQEFSFLNK